MFQLTKIVSGLRVVAPAVLLSVAMASQASAKDVTNQFSGAKVNRGTVTAETVEGRIVLTASLDFQLPDTPDPHWQVVDSAGNVHLLQRLTIKGDKVNRTITLPADIQDVAKVQVWCAWAEVVLGEASFRRPVS